MCVIYIYIYSAGEVACGGPCPSCHWCRNNSLFDGRVSTKQVDKPSWMGVCQHHALWRVAPPPCLAAVFGFISMYSYFVQKTVEPSLMGVCQQALWMVAPPCLAELCAVSFKCLVLLLTSLEYYFIFCSQQINMFQRQT